MSSQAAALSIADTHWAAQRDYLKRLLISLTHDLDLAEDLLQETYLLARGGWAGYRGGDVRAWLAAIARNAYYSHVRKRYVRAEVPLEVEAEQVAPCPDETLLVDLRQALAGLPPLLRDALLMKHYGGFSYHDIAARQHCPLGTAKWRVSSAITRVQASLGITRKEKIMSIPITRVLDYLYGRLPDGEAAAVRAMLAGSADGRAELQALEQVLHSLDAIESEVKCSNIAVLDAEGGETGYFFLGTAINHTDKTVDEADWTFHHSVELRAVLLQGQEVATRVVGQDGENTLYKSPYPCPVRPGESLGPALLVTFLRERVRVIDEHSRQYCAAGSVGISTGSAKDNLVFLTVVRLPPGATLVSADPPANEVHHNGTTTLSWLFISSDMMQSAPGQWQIAGDISYRL